MNTVRLNNEYLSVSVNNLGAELQSLTDKNGLEYIWQGDPKYWKRRSPILFPHVGVLKDGIAIHRDGKTYSSDIHGFAKDMEFTVDNCQDNHVEFLLESNDTTLSSYPYPFRFIVGFMLVEKALRVFMEAKNTGTSTMPFGMGGHPGFRCPLKNNLRFSDYSVIFEKEENQSCPYFIDRIYQVDKNRIILNNSRVLSLNYDDYKDNLLLFEDLQSSSLELRGPEDRPGLYFRWNGFRYLGIWTPPDLNAPLVSLEPWTSLPARSNEDSLFDNKHGILFVEPGESYKAWYEIEPISE